MAGDDATTGTVSANDLRMFCHDALMMVGVAQRMRRPRRTRW